MREFFAWCSPMEDGSFPAERGCVLHARKRGCDVGWPPVEDGRIREARWPLPNVGLGVSVEDQATADARIPALLDCPAAWRFVSYEPALGPVEWAHRWMPLPAYLSVSAAGPRLDWIIIGGESGPGARPFDLAWARDTIAQCKAASVPCFVKQLGARPVEYRMVDQSPASLVAHGEYEADPRLRLRHPKGADMTEWPADLRVREMPKGSTL